MQPFERPRQHPQAHTEHTNTNQRRTALRERASPDALGRAASPARTLAPSQLRAEHRGQRHASVPAPQTLPLALAGGSGGGPATHPTATQRPTMQPCAA